MSKNKVTRTIKKLVAANDPRALKIISHLERIAAADEQKEQRRNAERRHFHKKACFILGAWLIEQVEANVSYAHEIAAKAAGSSFQERDSVKLERAVELGVLPASFKPVPKQVATAGD